MVKETNKFKPKFLSWEESIKNCIMRLFVRSLLYSTLFLGLMSCGDNSQTTSQNTLPDSVIKSVLAEAENLAKADSADQSIVNKAFSFSNQLKDCNPQGFNKQWATMKFNPDGTVSSISAQAKNTGRDNFYELRLTSFGFYRLKDDIVTIEFSKLKQEKVEKGEITGTQSQDLKTNWTLKITQCEDGRMQLTSQMPNKNARGEAIIQKDQSAWLATI